MNLPFAFEEPFFDREVHAYDLRLAKAVIRNMENMCDYGGNHYEKDCDCDPYDTGAPYVPTEVKQNQ